MKILYVSDLDGTLLNMNQELNISTINKLNNLIEKGINFTVATGRGDSIRTILKDVHFKLPVMILNGTLNYDFTKKEYLNAKPIPNEKVLELMNLLGNFNTKTFEVQTIINNKVKRFSIANWDKSSKVLAINLLFAEKRKEELSNILNKIQGINFFIHKKVYSTGECFCDIILENVSKASRLKEFKEQYGFDRVISFGDSENDLPLAEVSDEFYAVENGTEVVKKNATAVIESCYNDGVANFIAKDLSRIQKNKI